MDREAEALPYLERAIELGDDDPNAYQLLLFARKAAKKHWAAKAGGGKTDGGKQAGGAFVPKAVATLVLNMRLRPETRTAWLEDGLDLMLRSKGLGYVNGGGSRLSPEGEIEACDIEMKLAEDSEDTRQAFSPPSKSSMSRKAPCSSIVPSAGTG